MKVLLAENIHPVAVARLKQEGFDVHTEKSALSENQLIEAVKVYDLIGIRSKTQITKKVVEASGPLMTIGAFCIGTNQIDLEAANRKGIPVFNAPYSNTRSVAEMVMAEIICLARGLMDKNTKAHLGVWDKSASGSKEVRGKVLGIVGYGHIGSQVSVLAESLGMSVVFYDVIKKLPLGNAVQANSLNDVLKVADFVTLHVPETNETKNMIGAYELGNMKPGSMLINASRGTVVVIEELVKMLKSGHLKGAAIDVFPYEPKGNDEEFITPLQNIPNVILSPHVGGSTEEAQEAIGIEVAESFIRYARIGSTTGSVNFPKVDLPIRPGVTRLLNVHKNEPGVLKNINRIIADTGANIAAQYLATDTNIGYLVVDLEKSQAQNVLDEINKLNTSIRSRLI